MSLFELPVLRIGLIDFRVRCFRVCAASPIFMTACFGFFCCFLWKETMGAVLSSFPFCSGGWVEGVLCFMYHGYAVQCCRGRMRKERERQLEGQTTKQRKKKGVFIISDQ